MFLNPALASLSGSLIVSCQPVPGGTLDNPSIVAGFALAALTGGAVGVRIEGLRNVVAVRSATPAPIIGLVKRDFDESPVRITALAEDVEGLAAAGADIIAFDATDRIRPESAHTLCAAIQRAGKLAMADISSLSEAREACAMHVDLVGTTLAGYTGGEEPQTPDFDLLQAVTKLSVPVIAEGCIRTPDQAANAIALGAFAVVVGSAITRPEHISGWFASAISGAAENARAEDSKAL